MSRALVLLVIMGCTNNKLPDNCDAYTVDCATLADDEEACWPYVEGNYFSSAEDCFPGSEVDGDACVSAEVSAHDEQLCGTCIAGRETRQELRVVICNDVATGRQQPTVPR